MPLVTASIELFRLGPAAAFLNGVYIGEVSETTPVEINYTLTGVDLKSARLGKVNTAITDYDAKVTIPVVEIDPARLALGIPGAVLTGGLLQVYFSPGFLIRGDTPKELKIYRLVGSPSAPSTDPDDIFTLYDVSPAPGTSKVTFNAKQQLELPIMFTAWSNPDTGLVWSTGS